MNANCIFCQQRPKYVEGTRVHDYCGRTCANKAAAQASAYTPQPSVYIPQPTYVPQPTLYVPQASWSAAPPPYSPGGSQTSGSPSSPAPPAPPADTSDLCNFCLLRPKAVDGARVHDYCSKSCAQGDKCLEMLASLGTSSTAPSFGAPSTASSTASSLGTSPAVPPKGQKSCKFNWCQRPVYSGGNGQSEYCSIRHKTLSETVCLMCQQGEKQSFSPFCSRTCARDAENAAPFILEVPAGHATFKSVAHQFQVSWRHSTTTPTVVRVYKIVLKQAFMAKYDAYRTQVENRGQFVAQGRSAGNENRRWHGTTRACLLGDSGNAKFCSSVNCSLCSIIRNSFDLNRFGKKTGWGRFGAGIYTSATSSKSNDYTSNTKASRTKAMLLNKVVVGKGYKMLQDSTSLTSAPRGFDSVLAEVGVSLNHDELIVYTNDAIRPSFLVIYEP